MNSSGKPAATDSSSGRQTEGQTTTSSGKDSQAVPKPNYELSATLTGHTGGVVSVKFSPDGKWLASASADKTARVWDPHACSLIHTLSGHTKGLSDLCWDPTSRYIATASDDFTLILWNADTGELLKSLKGHTHHVFCCAFSPNGNMLVSGSFDETIRLWDPLHGRCLKEIPAHSDPVTSVDFHKDGTLMASSSYEGLCRIWDTATGACLKTLIAPQYPPIAFCKFTPNGQFVLTASLDSSLTLWDYQGEKPKKSYKGHENAKHCCFGAFSTTDAKGRWVVSGSEDHSVYLWGLNHKQIVQVLAGRPSADSPGSGHCAPVLGVSCHPRISMIASSALASDCTIKLWADSAGSNL